MSSIKSLLEIANKNPTDKIDHGFVEVYDRAFGNRRGSVRRLLEVGVHEGSSLRMWSEYFPGAEVSGWDLRSYPAGAFGDLVSTYMVDQGSRDSMRAHLSAITLDGPIMYDVIIDDGSHRMKDQQETLATLWPLLSPGGSYVIEDLHTSLPNCPYEWAGGGCLPDFSNSTLRMLERLSSGAGLSSVYLSESEAYAVACSVESCEIFDTKGDGRHITSIIKKKPLARQASLYDAI